MKLSIITVNLNNREGLRKTIVSVINQKIDRFEYIVVDGDSSDGSAEVTREFNSSLDILIIEKDSGIYHAMNKGIVRATGEYILFLNSGDYLRDDDCLGKILNEARGEDIVYANILYQNSAAKWVKKYPEKLDFNHFLGDTIPHPGTIIKRALFQTHGLYNTNNKIVSDWEFFLTMIILHNATYRHVDFTMTVYPFDGISSKPENLEIIKQEVAAVLKMHFPNYKAAADNNETGTQSKPSMRVLKRLRNIFGP